MLYSTLHEAIAFTLSSKQPLTFKEIAETIKIKNLWRRPSDGKFPEAKQIRDRSVYKYPELFQLLDNGKLLLKKSVKYPLKITRLAYNNRGWSHRPAGNESLIQKVYMRLHTVLDTKNGYSISQRKLMVIHMGLLKVLGRPKISTVAMLIICSFSLLMVWKK